MLRRISILAVPALVAVLTAAPLQAAVTVDTVELGPDHDAEVESLHGALRESQERRWWAWAAIQEWNKAVAANEARARAAAVRRPTQTTHPRRAVAAPNPQDPNRSYACPQFATDENPSGIFAVPCAVIDNESDGGYRADNPGSSACGAYQIMRDTWNGYGGYPDACSAPASVQDEKARSMPLCHWDAPDYCAGE